MRRLAPAAFAVMLFATAAFAETMIETFAGGGPNNLPAVAASLNNPPAVAVDAAGNLYIAGPAQSRVFRVTNSGLLTVFAGTGESGYSGDGGPATQATLGCPTGLALDAAGDLYIADECNSVVRKVSGGVIGTAVGTGDFGSGGDGGPAVNASLGCPDGMAVDGAGSLYIADSCQQRVRKVTAGILTTFAGTGTAGFSGDGGPASNATLSSPMGVAADGAGNVYIADRDNRRVRKVTGGTISTFAGNGSSSASGDGGSATAAGIGCAAAVAVDTGGNVFVVDSCNNLVRKVAAGVITAFAGSGGFNFSGDGGPATAAGLCPAGAAADSAGNVFIADECNNRVREVQGGIINTVAGNGSGTYSGDGGPAANASLSFPTGSAVDAAGNLYFADQVNAVVRKVTGGIIATVAGNGNYAFSGDGGPALNSAMNPSAVVVDGTGNLYIADQGNNRVRKVTPGGTISTFAGNGSAVFSGDNGPATAAGVACPTGLALDAAGDLFIAESCRSRVRKVTPDGNIHTAAGTGTSGSGGDGGPAVNATLGCPFGLATDTAGSLFIVDMCQQNVRQVTTDGNIHTFAGTGVSGYSGDGGPATGAALSSPFGVAVDGAGDVFIADNSNNVIRRVSPGGTIDTFAGNGSFGFSGDGGPGTAAALACPVGIAADAAGSLFIADKCNNRIRRVSGGTTPGGGTSVVVGSSASLSTYGQLVTFTATLTPATATGAVQFFDGTTSLGTTSLAAGSAFLSTASLAAGAHSITAVYSGDGTLSGGTSPPLAQMVNRATPLFGNLSSPTINFGAALTTLSGTISLGALVPTGTVSIAFNGTSQSAAIQNDGSFSAAFATSSLAVFGSPYAITYGYGGDANFTSAADSTKALTVTPAPTSLVLTAPTVTYSSNGLVSVTVGSTAGVPMGNVALSVDGGAASSLPLSAGSATFTINSPNAGDHTLSASYAAQGNFAASSTTGNLHVNGTSTWTALASSINPATFGQSVTLTATVNVAAPGVGPAVGVVQFNIDGSPFGAPVGLAGGAASVSTSSLAAGLHTIMAAYLGNASFAASNGTLSQSVNPAPTVSAVTVTPNTQQYSDLVAFTATLSPAAVNGLASAQRVTFLVGTQVVGTAAVAATNGVLTATLASVALLEPVPFGTAPTRQMAPGVHTVTAVFGGVNPNFTVNNALTSLTITPEDARVIYTGALAASTPSAQSTTATITLSATIQDISATAATGGDTNPGDVRNATVTFVNRNTNATIATVPVGLANAADSKTGTATYEWPVNLGSASAASFTVGVIVGNYYTRNNPADNLVIAVSQPGNGWASGSGTLLLQSSAGMAAGGVSSVADFNFSEKFTGNGKKLQDGFQANIHNGARTYQITSNSIDSLAAADNSSAATFDGTATIQDITNPVRAVTLDANAVLQVNMTSTALGVTVWNQAGGLWFSNNWNGTSTVPQALRSGSLSIH